MKLNDTPLFVRHWVASWTALGLFLLGSMGMLATAGCGDSDETGLQGAQSPSGNGGGGAGGPDARRLPTDRLFPPNNPADDSLSGPAYGPGWTSTGHPRILLAPAFMTTLRQRQAAQTPEWSRLAQACDAHVQAAVEWPDGQHDPNLGIGEGYQGGGYFAPLLELGLCYQMLLPSAPSQAAAYAQKGIEILTKMSEPSGVHAVNPLRDDGYGIRFYGVGMALGYDWLYDAMSSADRQRIYAALNHWMSVYETSGFARNHPQGNYFAGYYAAKALGALATEGENPDAPAQWSDWLARVHGQMVAPYYTANLDGGGWPEGWNYGPLATMNMIWPLLAAQTAKGMDLLTPPSAPHFALHQGLHLIHFAWPDRQTLDDRALQYSGANPAAAPPWLYTVMAGALKIWGHASAPYVQSFATSVRATERGTAEPWQGFLFWDSQAAAQDVAALPLSYVSKGMEMAAMRSSWDTGAVWGAFASGPYVGNPDSGEEYYDEGTLAIVRGGRPLLVNAPAALQRDTPGTNDGDGYDDLIYGDMYDGGSRSIFNVFYVNVPTPYGQEGVGPLESTTRLSRFEDGGAYVISRGAALEDMYRRSGQSRAMLSWTRDVLYLRPQRFIVYDRTSVSSQSMDQWQAFHIPERLGAAGSAAPGTGRFDVGAGASYAGTISTVLPSGNQVQTVDLFGRGKVFRVEVRPTAASVDQRWLTVFDAADAPANAASAHPLSAAQGNVLEGPVLGAWLASGAGNEVALFGAGGADQDIQGPVRYVVPAAPTTHVATDFAPATEYTIEVQSGGGSHTVRIAPGPGLRSSPAGVLAFSVTADGVVAPAR